MRQTTSNHVSLQEIGLHPLKHWVKQKQLNFLKQALHHREGLNHDPLMFAILWRRLQWGCILPVFWTKRNTGIVGLLQAVRKSTKSSLVTYKAMNPDLNVHKVHGQTNPIVPESHMIAFSRPRLVSHNLRIETSKWARLPREQRLCQCGSSQTEEHIAFSRHCCCLRC